MSESDDRQFVERVAAPLRSAEPVDSTFDTRLMSAARAAIARGDAPWQQPDLRHHRGLRRPWLTRPRQVGVSPLAGLAAAAAFAAVVAGATITLMPNGQSTGPVAVAVPGAPQPELVRFMIVAPRAQRVSLVGDFNGWNAAVTPLGRDSSGAAWVVTVPLAAGTYQYAFVVDGEAWLADPTAPLSLEDDFGTPSSVLTVSGRRT